GRDQRSTGQPRGPGSRIWAGMGHTAACPRLRGNRLHGPARGRAPPERRREGQPGVPAPAPVLLQLRCGRALRVMGLSRKDILAGRVALLVGLVAAVVSNWSSLTSSPTASIIHSDLADYAKAVRRSALPLPGKLRLLDRLDALDAHFRSSPPVSLSRWR